MSRFLLALCLSLAPLAAAAQKADPAQVDAVSSAAECLALGLPEKWKQLQVVIDLPKPLADTGGVLYLVTLPDDRVTPFQPCDPNLPPSQLPPACTGVPQSINHIQFFFSLGQTF